MPQQYANSVLALALAVAFALIPFPLIFEGLYGYPMLDRAVYYAKIVDYNISVYYLEYNTLIDYFTGEYLWNFGIAYLSHELGIPPSTIFYIITTFVAWAFLREVICRAGFIYVPLIVSPLVVDLAFSQMRIAFAAAILTFFWRGQHGKMTTIVAYVICSSIHTAVVLLAMVHLVVIIFCRTKTSHIATLLLTGVVASAVTGPLREMVLGAIADRRAEYHDMSSSFSYMVFWVLLWLAMTISLKNIVHHIEARYTYVILTIAVINTFTGGYSTRWIAIAWPYLIITVSHLPYKPRWAAAVLFSVYILLLWAYWLRIL